MDDPQQLRENIKKLLHAQVITTERIHREIDRIDAIEHRLSLRELNIKALESRVAKLEGKS